MMWLVCATYGAGEMDTGGGLMLVRRASVGAGGTCACAELSCVVAWL